MFDNKKAEEQQIVCGCGSITEAEADALVEKIVDMNGIPDYFATGVAAGLYFASLENSDMRGATIEDFVRNAHEAYINEAAVKMVDKLVARKMRDMGGVLKVEVRHG